MLTAQQYRAKAAEFRTFLADTSRSPNEMKEFRKLEQTYKTLAENEEWMALISTRLFNGARFATTIPAPLRRKRRS